MLTNIRKYKKHLKAGCGVRVKRVRLEPPQVEVSIFVVFHEHLERANLGRQAESVELPPHLGEVLVNNLLSFGLLPVYPQIVEGLGGQLDHFSFRNNIQAELLIH